MPDPSWNYVAKIQKNLSTIVVSSLNNVNDSQKRFYDAYRHTVSIVQHVIAPEKKIILLSSIFHQINGNTCVDNGFGRWKRNFIFHPSSTFLKTEMPSIRAKDTFHEGKVCHIND